MATAPERDLSVVQRVGVGLRANAHRALKAPDDVVRNLVVALLAGGHALIEDHPGVGKTAMARAFAASVQAEFSRVQCTADLLPADLIGTMVFNQREALFEFHPGPVFANVVLVDEINRASPKTQSGLLECMQERGVTVDGRTHELARPFLVVATQNPAEYAGTYPLPEAQLDRFMVRLELGRRLSRAADYVGKLRAIRFAATSAGVPTLAERRGARRDLASGRSLLDRLRILVAMHPGGRRRAISRNPAADR